MSLKSYNHTCKYSLARACNVTDKDYVNNAFSYEIMFILKAIKSHFKVSYDKQNIKLVVIQYEIYETSLQSYITLMVKSYEIYETRQRFVA